MRRLPVLLAVTACCVAVAEPAAAASAAPGVVKVTAGARVCTGAVLTPRFVLTSGRCVRSAKTADLRAVPKARTTVGVKVAAVLRPTGRLRRTDLAVLQLTGVTTVAPVRLAPAARRAVRSRTRATVRGWRSARSLGKATGRVTARRGCRAGSGTLCVGTGRRAARSVARRCGDVTGALLTTRRGSRTVLTGIGTRSRRGCAKRPRLTFVDLSRRPVARFLRTALAGSGVAPVGEAPSVPATPGATAPGTTPPTTPGGAAPGPAAAADALAPYVGTWRGDVSEDRQGQQLTYPVTLTVSRTGQVGEVIGSTDYGNGSLCVGQLSYLGVVADGAVGFAERLTAGQRNCVDSGTVTLTIVSGQPQLTYTWYRPGGGAETSGVLARG